MIYVYLFLDLVKIEADMGTVLVHTSLCDSVGTNQQDQGLW